MRQETRFGSGSARRSGRSLGVLLIVVLLAVAGATAQVAAAEPISFDVKPQAMGPALRAFAEQANLQVYYPEDLVVGLKTAGVKGRLEIEPALQELLKGSGLGFQRPDAKTIVIVKLTGQTSEGPASHVAEAIIVTAGKREQEVREVAGSVTPVTSEVLETKGAESFADYLAAQPGVSFNASTPGISQINIRGVSTTAFIDQGQQTTGFYINEIPLTEPYFSVGLPDLDAFDVERVEVLRGPQGSLFGSATLGGAVHFITKPANPNATEARVELGSSSTTHADGLNYGAKAMVNVPLVANQLALRLVATTRDEPGYLDNVGVGVNGSTDLKVSGGRMTLDWRPTDRLHFVAFGMYSSTDNKDTPARYPALGEWQRDTKVLEPFKLETSVYSLRGEYFWDAASLTVNVAHTDKQQHLVSDVTPYFGSLFGSLVPYVYGPQDAFAKGDTVEARLTSVSSGRLEWLVGVSYTHTKEDFPSYFTGPGVTQAIETIFSPIFGAGIGERTAPDDIFFRAALPIDGKEKAVFGEATYRLSDRWRITFGGRYFDTDILTTNIQSGLLQFLSSGQVSLETSLPQHETKFTPKVSLSYEPNKDTLLYALVSQGFRFGGVNLAPPSSKYPTPETFGSDILTNYEVGVRLAWMDRRLTLDVTPYYLDWHDIQLRQARPDGFAYAINAGKAANKGVEVALHSLPSPRLALDAAVSYLDATLRQDVVDNWNGQTVVKAGTQLPMAAKWNAMASASWNLGGTLKSLVTASYRYVGSAPIDLAQTFRVGNYSLFDLRARISALGVDWEAFAENIADKRAVTTANTYAPYAETYVRPRTVGLRMIYDLK